MSKRNFTLLIIILVLVVIGVLGFLYSKRTVTLENIDVEDTNFISRFNPFGSNRTIPGGDTNTPVDVSGYEPGEGDEIQKLRRISSMPVAGFGLFQKERVKDIQPTPEDIEVEETTAPLTEFMPSVRYVERSTGNIYQTFVDNIIERKFSATIIPKIYEAHFGNNGESVVMRYLKTNGSTIETFVGTLPKEQLGGDTILDNEVVGSFLPENVKDISVSPDASKIFYLFTSGDGIIGTTLDLETDKKVQVFDSPFTEWLSWWPNNDMITISTKPSGREKGYMYAINPSKRDLSQILGNINGLTTLTSPSGKQILYSDNNLSLSIYDVNTGNSTLLGIRTLPEKCVWGKADDAIYCSVPKSISVGEYPDTWYQGEVSFEDQFWKITTENGSTILLLDPSTVIRGETIDGIKLALDENEDYLLFVNKSDSFLWKLELK